MALIVATSLLVGLVLAQRLRVLGLIPVILMAWLLTGIGGSLREDSLLTMVSAGLISAIALQLGYLFGLVIRAVLVVGRLPSSNTASGPEPLPQPINANSVR